MRKGFSGKVKSHKSPVSLKSVLLISVEEFLFYFVFTACNFHGCTSDCRKLGSYRRDYASDVVFVIPKPVY